MNDSEDCLVHRSLSTVHTPVQTPDTVFHVLEPIPAAVTNSAPPAEPRKGRPKGSKNKRKLTEFTDPSNVSASLGSNANTMIPIAPRNVMPRTVTPSTIARENEPVHWNPKLVEMLLKLRFEKYPQAFKRSSSKQMRGRTWTRIAFELELEAQQGITSEKVQNKFKSMHEIYLKLKQLATATGELPNYVIEPPCWPMMFQRFSTEPVEEDDANTIINNAVNGLSAFANSMVEYSKIKLADNAKSSEEDDLKREMDSLTQAVQRIGDNMDTNNILSKAMIDNLETNNKMMKDMCNCLETNNKAMAELLETNKVVRDILSKLFSQESARKA